MASIIQLFLPLFTFLIQLAAQVGLEMLPNIKEDIANLTETCLGIMAAFFTGNLTTDEAKDSLNILLDTLKAQGETLLGKLEIEEMKLPAELSGWLMGFLGSIPGKVLSLIP